MPMARSSRAMPAHAPGSSSTTAILNVSSLHLPLAPIERPVGSPGRQLNGCHALLRAHECDANIAGPACRLECGGPVLAHVWRVVADAQRVAFEGINALPHSLQVLFCILEINRRRLRTRVDADRARIEGLAVLGPDFEAVASEGEPVSRKVIGCLAVALRPCRGPGFFERRLSTRRVRAGENEYDPENQPTHLRSHPPHGTLSQLAALLDTDHILPGHALQRCSPRPEARRSAAAAGLR